MFKAVIFDLDGVLVDTADLHYIAWKQVSTEHDLICGSDMKDRVKGISRSACLDMILKENKRDLPENIKHDILLRKNDIYLDKIKTISNNDILPGAYELLNYLKNNDYKIALGSASKNASLILDKTGLIHLFDNIVDGNMISKAKPEPEVFLTAAKLVNTPPYHCLVIEDAKSGVEAANRAGMKVIGVGEEELLNNANCVVKNLNEPLVKEYISNCFLTQ